MEWYQVIKTIKGRKYLYWQKTYRQGGSVKTFNKYVGPAAAGPTRPAMPLSPSTYSITAPLTPEDVQNFFPKQKPVSDDERHYRKEDLKRVCDDERVRYGPLKQRKLRQAKQLRAARKLTKHLRSVNFFVAKLSLRRKK